MTNADLETIRRAISEVCAAYERGSVCATAERADKAEAEVKRWQAEAVEMSAQRSHNANQAGRLRAEVEQKSNLLVTAIKSAGDQAARAARAEAALAEDKARLDWLESPAGFDWQWNSTHSVIVRRAAIDAAMKP